MCTRKNTNGDLPESIPKVVENASRVARSPRRGSAFVSLPQDVMAEETSVEIDEAVPDCPQGPAPVASIQQAAAKIKRARQPVLLLGLESSRSENTDAVRRLPSEARS